MIRAAACNFTGKITNQVAWKLLREIIHCRELRPDGEPILGYLKIPPEDLLTDWFGINPHDGSDEGGPERWELACPIKGCQLTIKVSP